MRVFRRSAHGRLTHALVEHGAKNASIRRLPIAG
jgi:hypothetical protein